jgi:hypothetical protein
LKEQAENNQNQTSIIKDDEIDLIEVAKPFGREEGSF